MGRETMTVRFESKTEDMKSIEEANKQWREREASPLPATGTPDGEYKGTVRLGEIPDNERVFRNEPKTYFVPEDRRFDYLNLREVKEGMVGVEFRRHVTQLRTPHVSFDTKCVPELVKALCQLWYDKTGENLHDVQKIHNVQG